MGLPTLKQMFAELMQTCSVSCTTPSLDHSNEGIIRLLDDWCHALGFHTEVQPIPGFPGKFNLLAVKGKGPGGIVFAGHTDTVPCDEVLWSQPPFALTEKDNRWYGLGSADMKGFFPFVLEAARKFHDIEFTAPLILLATADEETSMCGARALKEMSIPKARHAIIGEPTGLRPVRLHKGIIMESILITGRSGHSSNPGYGASALEAMTDVLVDLRAWRQSLQEKYTNPLFEVPVPTMNFGCIHGGDNPNRICGACELQIDVRPVPGMDIHELQHIIRERVQPIAARHQVKAEVHSLFPGIPPFETSAQSDIVKLAERLTGHSAEAVGFGTEASFLNDLGMETIVLGPGNIEQAHQPDEYLDMERIRPTLTLVENLISRFCVN